MSPIEWLLGLRHDKNGHRKLLETSGGLPAAAHRLATAKCMSAETPTAVPSAREVRGAAQEIVANTSPAVAVPSAQTLAQDCEAQGLPVL